MGTPLHLRELASADIRASVRYYAMSGGTQVADRFIADWMAARDHLRENPMTGSLRWSHELDIPDLRHWPFEHFPHVVMYFALTDFVDVLRVVHARRNIPDIVREAV